MCAVANAACSSGTHCMVRREDKVFRRGARGKQLTCSSSAAKPALQPCRMFKRGCSKPFTCAIGNDDEAAELANDRIAIFINDLITLEKTTQGLDCRCSSSCLLSRRDCIAHADALSLIATAFVITTVVRQEHLHDVRCSRSHLPICV